MDSWSELYSFDVNFILYLYDHEFVLFVVIMVLEMPSQRSTSKFRPLILKINDLNGRNIVFLIKINKKKYKIWTVDLGDQRPKPLSRVLFSHKLTSRTFKINSFDRSTRCSCVA